MKKIVIIIFVFLIVVFLSVSIIIANNTNNQISDDNKEKIHYQIEYLDKEIINMSNLLIGLNNNNYNYYSPDNYINWEELDLRTEILYNFWNTAILDFNTVNIDKNVLTDFGKKLDNMVIAIKNKNKYDSLYNLSELYNILTICAKNLNYEENYTNILCAKYNLLVAYSILEKENWTLIYENILKSENYLLNIVNSMNDSKYSQYNINQAYVAIKELENIINVKDFDVFYLKYKIAMQKLCNI